MGPISKGREGGKGRGGRRKERRGEGEGTDSPLHREILDPPLVITLTLNISPHLK